MQKTTGCGGQRNLHVKADICISCFLTRCSVVFVDVKGIVCLFFNRLSLGRAEYKITLCLPITADVLMFSRKQESRGEFGDQRDLGSENSTACLCRADHKRVTPVQPVTTNINRTWRSSPQPVSCVSIEGCVYSAHPAFPQYSAAVTSLQRGRGG